MKTKLLSLLLLLAVGSTHLQAQYCGNSGTAVCTPLTGLEAGVFDAEQVSCIPRNTNISETIFFKNFTTFAYNGVDITIDSLHIDSIGNLPSGICWATNKSNNIFSRGEEGCLNFRGGTSALPGQYKLRMFVTAYTNIGTIGPNLDFETLNNVLYVRVVASATSVCPPIDTNQTANFVPGESIQELSQISGKVYIDANSNNTFDNGEIGVRNVQVSAGSNTALTNATGTYTLYVDPGTYQVAAHTDAGGGLSYANGTVQVSAAAGQQTSNVNFGATVAPDYCTALTSVVNTGMPPRPGFDNTVRVSLVNYLSASPLSLKLRLSYNSQLQTYLSSTLATSGQGSDYIEWDISGLALNSTWTVDIHFNTDIDSTFGQVLLYNVSATEVSCPNLLIRASEEVVVVGSYDPNDKAVSPVGYGSWYGVNPDKHEDFTYKIRFQNTGTFLAEKVVIVDTISQHLDLGTLKVLSASHNYEVEIGNNRAVKFIFNQIMLPDSNSNEPGSHGYVQYSIKPYAGLAQSVEITNRADIYFDFNPPILTNTTLTTIDYVDHTLTGIKGAQGGYRLSLHPNPANNMATLTIDKELIGKEVVLLNLNGQVLQSRIASDVTTTFDLGKLAAGVYIVKVESATLRLVKQ